MPLQAAIRMLQSDQFTKTEQLNDNVVEAGPQVPLRAAVAAWAAVVGVRGAMMPDDE